MVEGRHNVNTFFLCGRQQVLELIAHFSRFQFIHVVFIDVWILTWRYKHHLDNLFEPKLRIAIESKMNCQRFNLNLSPCQKTKWCSYRGVTFESCPVLLNLPSRHSAIVAVSRFAASLACNCDCTCSSFVTLDCAVPSLPNLSYPRWWAVMTMDSSLCWHADLDHSDLVSPLSL